MSITSSLLNKTFELLKETSRTGYHTSSTETSLNNVDHLIKLMREHRSEEQKKTIPKKRTLSQLKSGLVKFSDPFGDIPKVARVTTSDIITRGDEVRRRLVKKNIKNNPNEITYDEEQKINQRKSKGRFLLGMLGLATLLGILLYIGYLE